MPSERVRAESLKLVVDGKVVDIKNPGRRNGDLNRELRDPEKFRQFADDPRAFAARFDLDLDREISDALRLRLEGLRSMQDLRDLVDPLGPVGATVWAVASGAYSVATSKVAVAF